MSQTATLPLVTVKILLFIIFSKEAPFCYNFFSKEAAEGKK